MRAFACPTCSQLVFFENSACLRCGIELGLDWAETFAHYLHLRDALQTAAAYGVRVDGPVVSQPRAAGGIAEMIAAWLPLSYALNALNRSMGHGDLYPFVLPPAVIDKLAVVHEQVGLLATFHSRSATADHRHASSSTT